MGITLQRYYLIEDRGGLMVKKESLNSLYEALLDGDRTGSIKEVEKLCDIGVSSEEIVVQCIEAAMSELDEKCTIEQFNLLEIMLVGRAVMEVMNYLFPSKQLDIVNKKGTIVLVTLEGDIHDLGKNILKTILITKGYRVVDCGKNCPVEEFLEVTNREKPIAVGISGLIFTLTTLVKQVRQLLNSRGLEQVKVMVGGAALKQFEKDQLNVDFIAQTAFDSLSYLDQIRGVEKSG